MIKNFHQNIEQILEAASPEQKILWNDLFLRFSERLSVSQFCSSGAGAALGELGVYVARKIYLAYDFEIYGNYSLGVTPIYSILFNELNAAKAAIGNNSALWDATAAAPKYIGTSANYKNVWFSRVELSNAYYFKFIGFRITY